MQLHQLRYVVALAEEGQFVKAAGRLRVAQPSISAAVRALEVELGATLFDRSRHGALPTAAGEAFLPWARQALADCDAGVAAVEALGGLQRGRVTLGATPSLTTTLLPAVVADFRRAHPGVELVVDEAGSGDLVVRLEDNLVDVALIILPVAGSWLDTRVIGEEELVLAVPAGHELAHRDEVAVAELREVALVMFRVGYDLREVTLAACRSAGFRPAFAVEGLEMDGVLAMAAAGVGAAVVPASALPAAGGLVAVPFAGRELTRRIGVARRRDRTVSSAVGALVERIEAHLGAGHPPAGQRSAGSAPAPAGRRGPERSPQPLGAKTAGRPSPKARTASS